MNNAQRTEKVRQIAADVGFDAVRITNASPIETGQRYDQWLNAGMAGSMQYLHRNLEKRLQPTLLFEHTKSIICVGVNYYNDLAADQPIDRAGNIAMYAWGQDYHQVIRSMLHRLADVLQKHLQESFQWRAFVDTAPVCEVALAQRAGLGWAGKNGCLISPRFGPFLLLAELFSSLQLKDDQPAKDHCGTCDRCTRACPTGAIVQGRLLDARKCISYLTIEHRDQIDPPLREKIGDCLFGCDQCLQACPYTAKAEPTNCRDFKNLILGPQLSTAEVLAWNHDRYKHRCDNSAGSRATLSMWQRNARIVAENQARPAD